MKLKGTLHLRIELCLTFLDFKKTMSQEQFCKNFYLVGHGLFLSCLVLGMVVEVLENS